MTVTLQKLTLRVPYPIVSSASSEEDGGAAAPPARDAQHARSATAIATPNALREGA
jgi:hypothetical protein